MCYTWYKNVHCLLLDIGIYQLIIYKISMWPLKCLYHQCHLQMIGTMKVNPLCTEQEIKWVAQTSNESLFNFPKPCESLA